MYGSRFYQHYAGNEIPAPFNSRTVHGMMDPYFEAREDRLKRRREGMADYDQWRASMAFGVAATSLMSR